MKMNLWQTSLAVTASLSLSVSTFSIPASAGITQPQGSQSAASGQASLQNQGTNQLIAQANCRRVNTNASDLNVRSSPNGPITGSVAKGTLLTVDSVGNDGWVLISSPQKGYVFGQYLGTCDQPVPPNQTSTTGDNCRQITSAEAVSVRQSPSTNSPILGNLANLQRVTIVNRGASGWVPISAPVTGFIPANILIYCR
ncbi:SH3 domain-containing protein [Microcoleus sp. FACHB-68]|uniref:SH3 domain-containing protein n=1 Tax=Microcoleus sp. FACHB-68 TaxID=2692826 RepID=UPI0016892E1A|nr:SH3 domain-containing protein [Microcoleus sp. FACHB-68]MBD1940378.1 SH3 domain-containing protein [Microcoleus sp. FACHB-68]